MQLQILKAILALLVGIVHSTSAQHIRVKSDLITNIDTNQVSISKSSLDKSTFFNTINRFSIYEYAFITEPLSWSAHEAAAIEWGGHLASVHSEQELFFIQSNMESTTHYYTGGKRTSNNGWEWSDGSSFDYEGFWAAGEPNNWGGSEDRTMIFNLASSRGGFMNDVSQYRTYSAVYKKR